MADDVAARVDALDDKQAIYVVQKLSQAIFSRVKPPSYDEITATLDQAAANAGVALELPQQNQMLQAGDAGATARAVLRAWAADPALSPVVGEAVQQFKTARQDLGVLSVPLALGLTYVLLSMDLDLDLGFVKIKKKGLTSKQQTEVVKTTLDPVLKAIRGFG